MEEVEEEIKTNGTSNSSMKEEEKTPLIIHTHNNSSTKTACSSSGGDSQLRTKKHSGRLSSQRTQVSLRKTLSAAYTVQSNKSHRMHRLLSTAALRTKRTSTISITAVYLLIINSTNHLTPVLTPCLRQPTSSRRKKVEEYHRRRRRLPHLDSDHLLLAELESPLIT